MKRPNNTKGQNNFLKTISQDIARLTDRIYSTTLSLSEKKDKKGLFDHDLNFLENKFKSEFEEWKNATDENNYAEELCDLIIMAARILDKKGIDPDKAVLLKKSIVEKRFERVIKKLDENPVADAWEIYSQEKKRIDIPKFV